MATEKIGVIGASGFVGSTLCERLFFDKQYNFVAFIHNYGSAARISRFPIKIERINLLEFRQVKEAVSGCTTIVNCSRGDDETMIKGLQNMIRAAKVNNIQRFIHISSAAIYGDNPKPECKDESAQPNPGSNRYGAVKARQDDMVFQLNRSGIPSIILCPSNISGPYSFFILQAVKKVLCDEILLVDDGRYPSNLVHVENLVEAIITALRCGKGWGERYFVNDPGAITWKTFYQNLMRILNVKAQYSTISRDEVMKSPSGVSNHFNFGDNLKILLSGEFRKCLSMLPMFNRINDFAFEVFSSLNPEVQRKVRGKLERPILVNKESNQRKIDQLVKVQIRKVYHSPEKIINNLGFRPRVTCEEGMESTGQWLSFAGII